MGRLIREILAMDLSDDPLLAEAQAILARWDMSTDIDSRAAALGVLTAVRTIHNRHHGSMGHATGPGVAAADELMLHYGRPDPSWGEVNRMIRGDVDLPLVEAGHAEAIYGAGQALDENVDPCRCRGSHHVREWDATGEMRSRRSISTGRPRWIACHRIMPTRRCCSPRKPGESWILICRVRGIPRSSPSTATAKENPGAQAPGFSLSGSAPIS